jgi:hypothetical protein
MSVLVSSIPHIHGPIVVAFDESASNALDSYQTYHSTCLGNAPVQQAGR